MMIKLEKKGLLKVEMNQGTFFYSFFFLRLIVFYESRNVWFNYADHVPEPPIIYHFTSQQKSEINRFFHEKKFLHSPNFHLDLYQAAVVAVRKRLLNFNIN